MSLTISIALTDPTPADMALVAQLFGTTALTPVGTGATPATPPAVDYFPADWTKAPYPSPAGSKMPGAPYLLDRKGSKYVLDVAHPQPAIPGYPAAVGGYLCSINDIVTDPIPNPLPTDKWGIQFFTQLVVGTDGIVYGRVASGQWHTYTNGSWYNSGEPPLTPVAAPGASGTPVALPPLPTPAAVAPGSSGTVILAGPSQTIKTLAAAVAAAKAGDTIRLDKGAVFAESVLTTVPLLIDGQGGVDGVGGAILDGSGFTTYARGKGGIVPTADIIVQGVEGRGFGMKETQSGLTCFIRPDTGCGYITVRNSNVHDNQNGLGSGAIDCVWDVENSTIEHNGLGDGQSHGCYFAGGTRKVTVKNVTFKNQNGGHDLKSRALETSSDGCSFDASNASLIDIPDGSATPVTVTNYKFNKAADAVMHGLVGYCTESQLNGTAGMLLANGTINALCPNPFMQAPAGTITVANYTSTGNKVTGQGNVTGL